MRLKLITGVPARHHKGTLRYTALHCATLQLSNNTTCYAAPAPPHVCLPRPCTARYGGRRSATLHTARSGKVVVERAVCGITFDILLLDEELDTLLDERRVDGEARGEEFGHSGHEVGVRDGLARLERAHNRSVDLLLALLHHRGRLRRVRGRGRRRLRELGNGSERQHGRHHARRGRREGRVERERVRGGDERHGRCLLEDRRAREIGRAHV